MEKGQTRGIVIGNKKFRTIMYADDIILLKKKRIRIERNE